MVSYQLLIHYLGRDRTKKVWEQARKMKNMFIELPARIGALGINEGMDYLEKRKLKIFNLLVFFQMITIAIMPVEAIFTQTLRPVITLEMLLPALINGIVLWFNYHQKYDTARIFYFLVSPIVTGLIYMGGVNLGAELNFVLYGILAVFFITDIGKMIFSVALSMLTYYMLTFVLKNYQFELTNASFPLYLFNQAVTLVFIFYGLYLIKTENTIYQRRLLIKSRALHKKNLEINRQKKEIETKAALLEKQAAQLAESNAIKNKLFSVIAHDLRTPMYALRNLFQNVAQKSLTRTELKTLIPEVSKDLSFTTDLIENLLHWAKNQMQVHTIIPQSLYISRIAVDVLNILRLQVKAKNIQLENKLPEGLAILADSDMIHVVMRNLISNAIKFTPVNGRIIIGANEMQGYVEVYVRDTGVGISPEGLQKIRQNIFFSTKGTTNESGTGLGLMLCREFILKNGGHIFIESEQGQGTMISFTLPRGDEMLKAV